MNSITQLLRARTERVNAAVARLFDAAVISFGHMTTGITTFAWNVQPSALVPAICAHGKPYERRLQEMHT